MSVALVDNGTNEPHYLLSMLRGYDVEVFPLEEADHVLTKKFDFVVLSGSSRFPIMYNLDVLAGELRLIRECTAPLLGICFGAELINVAFGGSLRDTGSKRHGLYELNTTEAGADRLGAHTTWKAYEAHRWVIDQVAQSLLVLAESASGPEIIVHESRPIYGFQFHPEKALSETDGEALFTVFLKDANLSPSSTEVDS